MNLKMEDIFYTKRLLDRKIGEESMRPQVESKTCSGGIDICMFGGVISSVKKVSRQCAFCTFRRDHTLLQKLRNADLQSLFIGIIAYDHMYMSHSCGNHSQPSVNTVCDAYLSVGQLKMALLTCAQA
jgi:hypothetical protein